MRRVRAAASILPNEARGSVYIINGADTMNVQAQNAMLKVFEEPPAHATFVLLAENTDRLIPTIRSRCELIRLSPEEAERSPDSISAAKSILDAYIAHDDRSLIDALFALEKASRTELTDILSCLRELGVLAVADGKLSIDSFSLLTDTVDTAEKYASVNVSIGHIVGLMLAQLINK
jgi:DNA polymerase III delta prime subunit